MYGSEQIYTCSGYAFFPHPLSRQLFYSIYYLTKALVLILLASILSHIHLPYAPPNSAIRAPMSYSFTANSAAQSAHATTSAPNVE